MNKHTERIHPDQLRAGDQFALVLGDGSVYEFEYAVTAHPLFGDRPETVTVQTKGGTLTLPLDSWVHRQVTDA
jgi:hypothetical protein